MYRNLAEGMSISDVHEKLIGAAGLARRAGKLVIGGEMCEETIRAGKAEIVLLCNDMSENSKKKLHAAMKAREVPYIVLDMGKDELAVRFGKRSFAVALAITDKGFANIIYKALGITGEQLLHESK